MGVGHLRGAILWRGRSLGCGAGGGGGGALQGAQSLAEPGVLGCLDLIHQDAPLVLELLQSDKRRREESGGGTRRRSTLWTTCVQIIFSFVRSLPPLSGVCVY